MRPAPPHGPRQADPARAPSGLFGCNESSALLAPKMESRVHAATVKVAVK
jgi:hypothetical protein